jgi:hypothetical protein
MSVDPASVGIVMRWLGRLADLMNQRTDQPVSAEGMRDIAELLARDLPSGAFTTESLHAVADAEEWFPRYPVIRRLVATHWEATKPRSACPPAAPGRGMTAMDELWLKFWHTRQAELAGKPDPGWDSPDPRVRLKSMRGNLESLIRQQSPAAWAAISGRSEPVRPEPEQAEVEAVKAAVASLAAAHAGVPEPPLPRPARDVTAKGDQLAELRKGYLRAAVPKAPPPVAATASPEPPDTAQAEPAASAWEPLQ